jgi:hypothetical protein
MKTFETHSSAIGAIMVQFMLRSLKQLSSCKAHASRRGASWVFVAYPLCGLWLSAAVPFVLREAGRPGFAVMAGIALLFLGLMTVLILQ